MGVAEKGATEVGGKADVDQAKADRPMVDASSASGVSSVLRSLKEIVSIVMGLALTNSILALITKDHYISVVPIAELPIASVLYTVVLVVNIIRFYHGNMRHMDALYGEPARKVAASTHASLGNLGLDFSIVFLQSIIFAVISFYAAHRADFVLLFLVLLFVDLLWNLVTMQEANEARDVSHQRGWLVINVLAVILVTIFYFTYQYHRNQTVFVDLAIGVVALNTLADFVISWRFYFPSLKPTSAS